MLLDCNDAQHAKGHLRSPFGPACHGFVKSPTQSTCPAVSNQRMVMPGSGKLFSIGLHSNIQIRGIVATQRSRNFRSRFRQ